MKTRIALVTLFLSMLIAVHSSAQGRFEIHAFGGYRVGGEIDQRRSLLPEDPPTRFQFNEAAVYGLEFNVGITQAMYVGFLWSHQGTDLEPDAVLGIPIDLPVSIPSDIDHYQGVFLYHWGTPEDQVRPFVLGGLGVSHIDVEGLSGESKFSYSVGAGVKIFVTDPFGFRFQARYAPTYLSSDVDRVCDPFGCFFIEDTNYIHQFDFTGGIIVRF
jgi:hypothetical protein